MPSQAIDDRIYFKRRVKMLNRHSWSGELNLDITVQYKKIILSIEFNRGVAMFFSLSDKSNFQFKGMRFYDHSIYRLKQDEYKNWVLVNTTAFQEAKVLAHDSAKVKEKDYTIKLLSPLEALAVNRILDDLNSISS